MRKIVGVATEEGAVSRNGTSALSESLCDFSKLPTLDSPVSCYRRMVCFVLPCCMYDAKNWAGGLTPGQ